MVAIVSQYKTDKTDGGSLNVWVLPLSYVSQSPGLDKHAVLKPTTTSRLKVRHNLLNLYSFFKLGGNDKKRVWYFLSLMCLFISHFYLFSLPRSKGQNFCFVPADFWIIYLIFTSHSKPDSQPEPGRQTSNPPASSLTFSGGFWEKILHDEYSLILYWQEFHFLY